MVYIYTLGRSSRLEPLPSSLSSLLSSHATGTGPLAGGVLCVAVGVGIQMATGNTEENGFLGDRLSIAFAGLWWVACAFGYSFRGMRARPGPRLTRSVREVSLAKCA